MKLVACVMINLFLSLVNDTFSNLKLIVSIIGVFICSKKEVRQGVLINHSWIYPPPPSLFKENRDLSSVYSTAK